MPWISRAIRAGWRRCGEKLEANRLTTPLFDSPSFTRHLEAAYPTMWRLHEAGKARETFRIGAG